jgi:hypothetical protein
MLAALTSRQITELQAYMVVEPFGEAGAYLRSGIVASSIYNSKRGKESDPMLKPSDFMPGVTAAKPAPVAKPGALIAAIKQAFTKRAKR